LLFLCSHVGRPMTLAIRSTLRDFLVYPQAHTRQLMRRVGGLLRTGSV
jgi:hypothetical protein